MTCVLEVYRELTLVTDVEPKSWSVTAHRAPEPSHATT